MGRLVKSAGSKAPLVEAAKGIAPLAEPAGPRPRRRRASIRMPGRTSRTRRSTSPISATRSSPPTRTAAPPTRPTPPPILSQLDALDAEIRAAVARIPADRRRIITSHDAFAYFEKAYGLDFVAPQGVSTEAEASAKDVARIIQQIQAREDPGGVLRKHLGSRASWSGSPRRPVPGSASASIRTRSPDLGGPAATYIDMMRHNIKGVQHGALL